MLTRNVLVQARIAKLRAHHELAAKALRTKIELRINRVPKRMWTKTLREVQTELRLGRPAPTVKGAGLVRVHKQAAAPTTTAAEKRLAMKKSPAKITLANYAAPTAAAAAFSALSSTAAGHKPVAPLSPSKRQGGGALSPIKPLYPSLPDMPHYMRSPSSLAVREQAGEQGRGPKTGSVRVQKAVTMTAPLAAASMAATTTSATTTKQARVVKKTASNSSLTSSSATSATASKPKQTTTTAAGSVARPGSAASTTGTGRRVGRPPKVKPAAVEQQASSDLAGEGTRRAVTRNLRSRG